MTIRIGQPTPELAVEAYVRGESTPRKMQLSELQGRWIVLFFYPVPLDGEGRLVTSQSGFSGNSA